MPSAAERMGTAVASGPAAGGNAIGRGGAHGTEGGYSQAPPLPISILQPHWPSFPTTLDDSQLGATKELLTKEFGVVQGPPGTGKTFLGLKVRHLLTTLY